MNYIYLVRNKETKESYYVGQTTNLQARANDHFKNPSFINPEIICLKETDNKDVADFFEAHFTLLYKTYEISSEHTYNVKIGTFQRAQIFNDNAEQYKVDDGVRTKLINYKQDIRKLKLSESSKNKEIRKLKQSESSKNKEIRKLKEENHQLKMDKRKLSKELHSVKIEYDYYRRYYFKINNIR